MHTICPKCGSIAEYNAYYGRITCTSCAWESEPGEDITKFLKGNKMKKTRKDSYTEQAHILTQKDLNGYDRLFGGRLMEWIDITAAVAARRHCNKNVTTAAVSQLNFSAPAYANDTIVLCAYVVYTGKTSMDVCVRTYVENLDGTRKEINVAYLVMVALDENEKPTAVPELEPLNDEEIKEWKLAETRRQMYAAQKK